jgi:HAE1 family hydrophobic/amphiphilic exporter-1
MPVIWLGLTAEDASTSLFELMMYAKDFVQTQFGMVSGVGNVVLGGYVDPALRVWLNVDRMNRFDLTSADVLSALQKEQMELPAGKLENVQNQSYIRILSEAISPKSFGEIRIQHRASQGSSDRAILLREIADIEEATLDVRRLTRMNQKKAVGVGIIKEHGSNAVAVADAVKKKLKELQPQISKKFHLGLRTDTTVFIKQSVRQLIFTLGISALFTSFVCYFFLGSWTSTLNVLLSIPTSIIGTFTAFYFFHFTLNTFTLLGLSLAIGIVVDDAIMMLENIVRHREMKKSKRTAAIEGAEEITFAAIAATIAVAAIFIPVVFMKGVIGKYFFQYGMTVVVAVFLSLLEALTLTPMRCSRYLVVKEHHILWIDLFFKKLSQSYEKILKKLLKHRWKTLGVSLLFFVLSFGIAKMIPFEMMPAQDQSMYMLRFKFPVGTSLWVSSEKMKEVEDDLLTMPETQNVISAVGGFGGDAVNQGQIYVTLTDRNQRKRSQSAIIQAVRKKWSKKDPQMEMTVQDLSLRGFAATRGFPVEVVIQGPNWKLLEDLSEKIMQGMKESRRVVDVNTDVQNGMPEVQILPNRAKLASHGVSIATVTQLIQTLMGGTVLTDQTQYPQQGHRYPIEVRMVGSQRSCVEDLSRVMVRNNRGERIALNQLVDIKHTPSLLLISRLNRARAITIYGNPGQGYSQQEALQFTERLARSLLPPGYTLKMVGSSQAFRESFQSLWVALFLGILVSYMVLASQFNSFIHPISVLMALPFSFSGAFLALALGRQSVNMYSLIGFILLMGIVKKNSILIVDFTNQCRQSIQDVNAALAYACPVRLRPILMTSFATVAGALPEAFSFGPGSEAMAPMAIALVGGVIASTVLTLFVVPCIYSLMAVFETKT